MYATMWSLDMRFDTRLFAIVSCMLSYLALLLLDFGAGIRNLVNYLTATRRIQVCLKVFLHYSFEIKGIFLQTFLLLEESQRDGRLLTMTNELESSGYLSTHKINNGENSVNQTTIKKLSTVECHLERAQWQQVNTFFCFLLFQMVSPFILV
jgi:hypothetical protein